MSTPFNPYWLEMGAVVPVDIQTTEALIREITLLKNNLGQKPTVPKKDTYMNKEEALKLIKLLSALESWSFSTKTDLPDYLHEDMSLAVERLEKIVLEERS